jgi:hypothetical protein
MPVTGLTTPVNSHSKARACGVARRLITNIEGKYIGRFVEPALRVCFRAASHTVAGLFDGNAAIGKYI